MYIFIASIIYWLMYTYFLLQPDKTTIWYSSYLLLHNKIPKLDDLISFLIAWKID
jgi:hypothetical protein